jgi:hypothetical protein
MTCPYYSIDFFDVIVPILYFVDIHQSALLIKMSKLNMHIIYDLLSFTWF